jgi:hypothetical protein
VVVHVRPWPDRASAPLIYSFLRCAFVCLPLPEFTALAKRKMDECQMHHSLQSAFTRVRPGRTTVGTPLMKTLQELVRARPRKQEPGPILQQCAATSFCVVRSERDETTTADGCVVTRQPRRLWKVLSRTVLRFQGLRIRQVHFAKKKEAAETHVGDYGRKLYRIRVFYKFV